MMMCDAHANLPACHTCPLVRLTTAGRGECGVDGEDIIDHAERGECPHPGGSRFGVLLPVSPGPTLKVARKPPQPIPREKWPRVVKLIAWRRKEGDAGVGDTLARLIPAGDALKAFTKKHGIDCGCGRRQERLNEVYPYSTYSTRSTTPFLKWM